MPDIRGRFVWYENLTKDVDAALAFYRAVIGWSTQSWTGMGEPYYMFANGGAVLAGLMKMPPEAEMPPHLVGAAASTENEMSPDATGATMPPIPGSRLP